MKKKEIYDLIESEITWCLENPQNQPLDWRYGFIEGMKQIKRIIKEYRNPND